MTGDLSGAGTESVQGAFRELDRYGGGSVMAWGGIHLNGRTPLYVIQGSVTGLVYRDEIMRPLIQPAQQAMGPGASFAGRQRHSSQNSGRHRLPAAAGDPQDALAHPLS